MGITDFLDPQAIVLQMDAKSSTEVIQQLGSTLNDLGFVKADFVEAAIARETEYPTGLLLGGNVNAAIPHVDCDYVNRSAVGFATLKKPALFHRMDETDQEIPVQLVIMLALDKPKSQVEMLQQVALILQQPETVQRLMEAAKAEEVLSILKDVENSTP